MTDGPIDLEGYFPFFLGTISNRWTTVSSRSYLERFGIGIADWRVLASIRSLGTASAQEIVALISMDAGAVSRSLARLQQGGFALPVEGKFAGRTKPFELTAEGRQLYAAIQEVALARETKLLAGLSAAERADLLRLMGKIMGNLSDL